MKEKLSEYALILLGILALIVLLYISVSYLLPIFLPFVIAWLIASLTLGPSRRIAKETGIGENALRLILSLLLTISITAVIGILLWQVVNAIWRFIADLGEGDRIYDLLNTIFSEDFLLLGDKIPGELSLKIREMLENFISTLFSALAGVATSLVGALPQVFFVMLVTLISLVYFALDYDRISGFVKSILPTEWVKRIVRLRDGIFSTLKKYLISYLMILLITFAVILSGLLLLRVEHALLIAMLVAFLDVLPIIGVGTVLVPWSILELSFGNRGVGIGLLVLFVVNAVIRQLAEPKIVGKSLSLHPIVTLILLYLGYSLFGALGLVILPVAAVSIGVLLKGDNSSEVA